jgi:hypothetical protein
MNRGQMKLTLEAPAGAQAFPTLVFVFGVPVM